MDLKKINIVFMGTPEFAVPSLEILNKNFNILAVITQEDKKSGRGKKVNMPPIKVKAIELGLPVYQFEKINSEAAKEFLNSLDIDFIVVVAYGQILKKWLIDLPKYNCLNVHASLLPELRGASPIQTALLQGLKKTGITIMQIDEGLDTGDMLNKAEIEIDDSMDFEDLHNKLKDLGNDILIKSIKDIVENKAEFVKQDSQKATYANLIKKEDLKIDFNNKKLDIFNKVRAFSPVPGSYCYFNSKRVKIFKTSISNNFNNQIDNFKNGDIVFITDKSLFVKCSDGVIEIVEIQLENSKRMLISEFLKGHSLKIGEQFY